ncbi:MAG: DNA phosphorothioation-associated protein 4 [Candidatus Dadabacteria bacterium]|nr:DNA phosphorothioation-associated protein 4 [Candidatus Dadabacteria bacterium]
MNSRAPNINRSRIHEDLVQKLAVQKLNGAQRSLFPTIRELLCFAAILGYSENRRIPLDKDEGVEDISYQQFERGDAEDLVYLIALAEEKDPEILRDGNEGSCAEIFEEYANGGLQVIQEALVRGGGEYPDRDIMEMLKEKGFLEGDSSELDVSEINF